MKKQRSFLKWAGGKLALVDKIKPHLPEGDRLIEPFVGAGAVFLNTQYSSYLLADINQDLISLFNIVKKKPITFIRDAQDFFHPKTNHSEAFYRIRTEFNQSTDPYQRALLFLYLNRHCYNGLCRYNLKGEFNVPFGQYQKPYFPEAEILYFAEKAQNAQFICTSYENSMSHACENSVVYCDPPYAPLSKTANFTTYHTNGFTLDDQNQLASMAMQLSKQKNVPVLISNHDTDLTRLWYKEAKLYTIKTRRFISRNGNNRPEIHELLAVFAKTHTN